MVTGAGLQSSPKQGACRFMAKLILQALTAQASGTPVPLRRPLRAVIPVRFEEGLNGGVAEPR
jgi:hypothetical protein